MRTSWQVLDRVEVVFDDTNAVAFGGLSLPMTLAGRFGGHCLLDDVPPRTGEHVVPGHGAGESVAWQRFASSRRSLWYPRSHREVDSSAARRPWHPGSKHRCEHWPRVLGSSTRRQPRGRLFRPWPLGRGLPLLQGKGVQQGRSLRPGSPWALRKRFPGFRSL